MKTKNKMQNSNLKINSVNSFLYFDFPSSFDNLKVLFLVVLHK